MKLFGSLTAISFSPIVTIEPRRRKFHCPIKLKIPLPSGYRPETSSNLRLLCSITGGQSRAVWEDVTGSTPLSIHEKCLLFTTTVSARFWLVHCQRAQRCADAARFAQELWRYLVQVPFMAKFVVFAKRRDISEAQVRIFCMTDDKEEKTLEVQEHYTLVARSRDVEVLDNQLLYLEFGGNLIPAHLSQSGGVRSGDVRNRNSGLLVASSSALLNEQLVFDFRAFQENRLAFACRLREVAKEPSGRIAFMEDSLKYLASLNSQQRAYLNERRRRAVCTLGVQLPAMCVHYDNILGTPKRNSYYATARIGDLTLADIASELAIRPVPNSVAPQQRNAIGGQDGTGSELLFSDQDDLDSLNEPQLSASGSGGRKLDWMLLAPKVGIPRDEVDFIAEHCGGSGGSGNNGGKAAVTPALLFLMHWYRLSSADDRDQDLARGLCAIGREDIARKLNFPIEPKRISRSTAELLREIEAIPVRSTENLYGTSSELSGYATSGGLGRRGYQPGQGQAARGTSLRRLDSQPSVDENSFEQQRARAGSASSVSRPLQQQQQAQHQQQQPGNYFSSGLRSAGQSFENDNDVPKATQVPAIEVSQVNGLPEKESNQFDEYDREMDITREGGDLTSAGTTRPQTSSPTSEASRPHHRAPILSQQGDSNEQQRVQVEQVAQNMVEDLLNDAFEAYLRRELQQTAEEAVREALAAVGGGGGDGGQSTSERRQLRDEDDLEARGRPLMDDRDEEDVESYSRVMEQTRISETITSTKSKPQSASKRQRRRKASELASLGPAPLGVAESQASWCAKLTIGGEAPQRSLWDYRRQHRDRGRDEPRQPRGNNEKCLQECAGTAHRNTSDSPTARTKAAADGAPSSVCAVQCAENVCAILESAGSNSSASTTAPSNPDLDSSDNSERTALARYCCLKPRGTRRRNCRRLNSSSSSAAGGGSTRVGEQQAGASARETRAAESSGAACLRLRQRAGGGGGETQTKRAPATSDTRTTQSTRNSRVFNVDCGAHELSCARLRRRTKSTSTETTQKDCDSTANRKSWVAWGKSCLCARSSSKASRAGPNERADLDLGAHSSREGCAPKLLAQSSELSARRPPSKFKAVVACGPLGVRSGTTLERHASAFPLSQLQSATLLDGELPLQTAGNATDVPMAAGVAAAANTATNSWKHQGQGLARRAKRTRDVTSGDVEKCNALETMRESNFTLKEDNLARRNKSNNTGDKARSGQANCTARAKEALAALADDLDKRAQEWRPLGAAAQFSIDIELDDARTKRIAQRSCADVACNSPHASALICEIGARACCEVQQQQNNNNTSRQCFALPSRRAKGVARSRCCCFSSDNAIHLLATSHSRRSRAKGHWLSATTPDFRVTRVIEDKLLLLLAGGDNDDHDDNQPGEVRSERSKLARESETQVRRCSASQFELAANYKTRTSNPSVCVPSLIFQRRKLFVRSVSLRSKYFEESRVINSRSAGNFNSLARSGRDEKSRRRGRSLLLELSIGSSYTSDNLRRSQSTSASYRTALVNCTQTTSSYYDCQSTTFPSRSPTTTCDGFATCSSETTTSETFRTAEQDESDCETLHSSARTPPDTPTNMVSFVESADGLETTNSSRAAGNAPGAEMPTTMLDEEDLGAELGLAEDDQASTSSDTASRLKRQQQQQQQRTQVRGGVQPPQQLITSLELDDDDLVDEEQLKRILACKRLSEGNCGQASAGHNHQRPPTSGSAHLASICRKNSLHMIGESLPPVTEGVPVRHHHHQQADSPVGSLRSKACQLGGKRNSQDDNTASCSSSTSLDGSSGGSGPLSRRRSSTVSQCSSVLSEGTRQQLNFDLSPDLPPDSSILEANAISPVDFERPASPEPMSSPLDSNEECSFDMRPISRMSGNFCSGDEIMLTPDSPDSTLGDSNRAEIHTNIDTNRQVAEFVDSEQRREANNIRDNLERIISHVSTVRVSGGGVSGSTGTADAISREAHEEASGGVSAAGQKRAHTPFGLNIQRNKTTHMSPATPSPTAHLSEASAKVSATCE